MAPRKQVPSLFNFSGQTLASVLITACEKFLNDAISVDVFIESIKFLEQSRNILVHSQPKIAEVWLNTADKVFCQWRSSSSDPNDCSSYSIPKIAFVVQSLVFVATQFSVSRLSLSQYSEPVQFSFLTHSERINNWQFLDCALWKEVECLNQQVFDSLPLLKNLTDFTFSKCTDVMIMTLCKNCKHLERITLDGSSKVTDKSMKYLAHLKKLQTLDLIGTRVTEKKLVTFLLTSESAAFKDIVGFDVWFDVNVFLNQLEIQVEPFRTFNLQYMWCANADSYLLSLIPKYFPRIKSVRLTNFLKSIPDLAFLNSLKYLKVAELCVTENIGVSPSRHIFKLFSLRCPLLTELTVFFGDDDGESDEQIDLHSFLNLGLQCPNLKSIRLDDCSFYNDFGTTHLTRNPFKKLKSFQMSCSSSVTGVETVLSCGLNLEKISIRTNARLSDDFLASVFQVNPLRKLKTLELCGSGGCISVPMMQFVIKNCPKITYLHLTPTLTADFEEAKEFVIQNNFNVVLQ